MKLFSFGLLGCIVLFSCTYEKIELSTVEPPIVGHECKDIIHLSDVVGSYSGVVIYESTNHPDTIIGYTMVVVDSASDGSFRAYSPSPPHIEDVNFGSITNCDNDGKRLYCHWQTNSLSVWYDFVARLG